MSKFPSEIFGYYWLNNSKEAKKSRQKHWCPFHNSTCYKQSRLVSIPFGVCTAHFNGDELALCPRRFLENNTIFNDIALLSFGTTNNTVVFSEVGLKGIGNFDFVMIKHRPLTLEIEDFVVIEFQTGQTTSTGKLVNGFKDFMNKGNFNKNKNYNFGLNSYDIWKRTFTQILNKGIILEKWNKRIYWVIQNQIFDYFQKKYRLAELTYDVNNANVFTLYDLKISGKKLILKSTNTISSTIDNLFDSFRKNDEIPPVETFFKRLENKMKKDFTFSLRLDFDEVSSYIDAPRPSSTGRIREEDKPET